MQLINLLDKILLSPTAAEDFYREYVDGSTFKNELDGLIPEVQLCQNQAQRTPWHKYCVLEHILHSVEAMNSLTVNMSTEKRRLLAYVMFLHDVGKPAAHVVKIVDGKEADGFKGHHIKSVEIAERILPSLGFTESERAVILKLIFKHDVFISIKPFKTDKPYFRTLSYKVIREEIADLSSVGDGRELFNYLLLVGRSDNLAQNEKMTPPALNLLEKIENMLKDLR